MSDTYLFADEPTDAGLPAQQDQAYKILIVDDDEEIHVITRMALSDFKLEGRPLSFHSAYSGDEAMEKLRQEPDFALVLLDVVMETDHAGLDVARWIREELNNRLIRIVLRTGQPGQSPEEDIIARYEIDDYKEKTELTYRKLVTLMYSSLRSYRELRRLERNREALERIIRASAELFTASSLRELSQGILQQLVALLTHAESAAYCNLNGLTASRGDNASFEVIAGTGAYQDRIGQQLHQQVDAAVIRDLAERQQAVCYQLSGHSYYALYTTSDQHHYLLFIDGISSLNASDQSLLELFMNNTAIAFEQARQHGIQDAPDET
ncbi:DUF3369 domain-containing protein [Aliidiomarina sp. Khilg15.8]